MKYPPKLASILVVAVLGMAGLGIVTSAWGDPPGGERFRHGGPGKHKHHGMKGCDRHVVKYYKRWHHGSDRLAKKLTVMETEIGIRANQLDAWRDFTDALLALMRPLTAEGGMPEMGQAFSLPEFLANRTIDRAKSAEALKAAIGTLRTTLTPEQLDKVKVIEAELRKKFETRHGKGAHFGPPPSDDDSGEPETDTPEPPGEPAAPGVEDDDSL